MKELHISWREISRLARNITEQIPAPTHVAAISRGGLVLGTMLSHHWAVPLIPVQWSTREHFNKRMADAMLILNTLSDSDSNHVLLVDDICDTGASLKELTDILYHHHVPHARESITTACLFRRPNSVFVPDLTGEVVDQDAQVVFPWTVILAPNSEKA